MQVALGSGQMLLEVDVCRRQLDRALKLGNCLVEVGLVAETEAQEVVRHRIVRIGLERLTRERDGVRVVLAASTPQSRRHERPQASAGSTDSA